MNKLTISYLLVFFLLSLLPFQDMAVNLVPFIVLIIISLCFSFNFKCSPNKYIYLLLFTFLNFLYLIYIYSIFGSELNNENLFLKGIKIFLYYGVFFVILFSYKFPLMRQLFKKKYILLPLYINFFITLLGLIYFYFYPDNLSFFHQTLNLNGRPRGFSLEASTLGIHFSLSSLLLIYFSNSKIYRFFLYALILAVSVYMGSKGLLLAIILSFFISLVKSKKFIIFTIFFPIILFVIDLFVATFIANLAYTSFSTRLTYLTTALKILFYNPLGVGFFGWFPFILEYLNDTNQFLTSSTNLNLSEINSHIESGSDKNITAKSFFLNSIIIFGFPFLIFLYNFLKLLKMFFLTKNLPAQFIVIVSFVSLLYNEGYLMYIIPLSLSILISNLFFEKNK